MAAVFASLALVITCQIVLAVRVSAADNTVVGELNSAEHFNISNGVLYGLSSDGLAIANNSTALHVTIPDGVTVIGNINSSSHLFGSQDNNKKVTVLTFPSSLTQIGTYAFRYCEVLTSVDLSGATSLTNIGNYAFEGCRGLTSVDLSGATSLTNIGDYAFYNCSYLTSIAIPDSVTSIGNSAFYNCSRLTSIAIPEGVTSISYSMFYNCRGLTSITIPASVTSIGSYAFQYCRGLTSIAIPDSVTSIGTYAFNFCSGSTSVDLSATSVTKFDSSLFADCSKLIYVQVPGTLTSISSSAFNNTDAKMICPDMTTYDNYLTTFSEYADRFTYAMNLQVNLTDHLGQNQTATVKRLKGDTYLDWYYEDGQWVIDDTKTLSLPALPTNWIWQDTDGNEITADYLQNQFDNATTDTMTLDAVAYNTEIATPTANTNTFTYNGTEQTYLPVGFNAETMTITNNTRTEVGTQTVTVTAKDGYTFATGDTVTFEFTIVPQTIATPTANTDTFTYNGTEQTYLPVGFDANTMTITNNTRTEAGTQTVTVTAKANYTFADGTTATFTFTIARKTIATPTANTDTFTYNGTEQTYLPVGFNAETMTITDNTRTEVGTQTVTVTAKANYTFADGTTATFTFTIGEASTDPETPTDPENPTDPTDPTDPENPTDTDETNQNGIDLQLLGWILGGGFGIASLGGGVVGALLVALKRKKK